MRCDENGEDVLAVKFRFICLWEMDPKPIVAKHLLPFYIFLPAMKDPSVDLLMQALKEMAHSYGRAELGYRFTWFSHILHRTDTMSDQDKETIEEVLKMTFKYEEIIRDDPVIQKLLNQSKVEGEARGEARGKALGKAEGEARGKALGKIEGKMEGRNEELKDSILNFLNIRFSPALAAQAQPIIIATHSYDVLKMLFRQLMKAPDEQSALLILDLPNEQSNYVSPDLLHRQSNDVSSDLSNE